ncbi:phosphopantetheine-binding protein [Chitinilyticum litopenaei]|uniref:phosphopantetheine-binding protein n=1 Tax=Chitinilyticum litopenaei TaxID=1121276 RepID=UPI000429EC41|nr:phosphopantetheine-binding protein [Chitinilyticum litopenaei]
MDNALISEIKLFVIETLNLEDVGADDIDSDAPLFGDGLGLDSIDALELGVGLQKRYGIKLQSDAAENRRHFASIRALAELVQAQRAGQA